jgi:hypothetical protein
MAADVTILIPNWNGAERLRGLLCALSLQTVPAARVLVVDNGSTDGSQNVAMALEAEYLPLNSNRGFAVAVNFGIRASTTRWVAVLNNDVEPEPCWLERLLSAAERTGADYAAGRLVNWNHPDTLDGCYDLLSRSGLAWRAGHGQPAERYLQPCPIRCAPFTALLLRRTLFDDVGLLDERFGSYLEDVDFGLRCASAGFKGTYEPAAVAKHEGSATLGRWSPKMVELLSRNQILLIAKHFPEGWTARFGFPVLVGQVLWGLLALRHGRLLSWLRGKSEALANWGDWRRHAEATPGEMLDTIFREDEQLIRELQMAGRRDMFWSIYFKCLGNS